MSILITGYSGNVGSAVSNYFDENKLSYTLGVRNPKKYSDLLGEVRKLDFEEPSTFKTALDGIDSLFLVRPPQLTDVDLIFKPFIEACVSSGLKHIVFLSLLGVEKNPFPPHHKIEKLIEKSGLSFTFIRPSFFMQNLIEPHRKEIIERDEIFIPSGKAKISFIDTKDIGEIIGRVLLEKKHRQKKYDITGKEAIDYYKVAKKMSLILKRKITYVNPGLLKFRKQMIKNGITKEFSNVMTLLYLSTKMGMAKKVTRTAEEILERPPGSIEDFIIRNKDVWEKQTI